MSPVLCSWCFPEIFAPPPSVGGLDLDSRSSGCARQLKKKTEILLPESRVPAGPIEVNVHERSRQVPSTSAISRRSE